ncbi:chemotaxis protein CheW [Saccharospirillum salsuginis]|uniref:CheW-like domain-containing protein n=1 Tax=Saccharospirillum salsuginis TaxID=418750 RepID=A0A918N968_9GAMM|nr:chemotaxis protein CheW [Saccharospirillum salsuginis]GGX50877.1 hypothetical protein GCM10007392_17600 [Saccharospirillum salsuginis]
MNAHASRKDKPDNRQHRTQTRELAADKTLANYLDAMLHEATQSQTEETYDWPYEPVELPVTSDPVPEQALAEPEPEPEPQTRLKADPAPQPVAPEPEPEVEPEIEPVATEPETEEATPEPVDEIDPHDLSRWLDNGRPAWAQERFDCLVFVVDGLKLAVPLLLLGNIHPLERELTPLFDQPKWFLGLLPIQQDKKNIRVVDTARLVMPERYRPESAENLAYAVGVHGSDWAFGCHAIEGSITLEPEDVKWRTKRTSRPWLAGTVIDQMCALVDLNAFAKTALV